jgi:predicted lipid-binding transport protein (Tim44 family)
MTTQDDNTMQPPADEPMVRDASSEDETSPAPTVDSSSTTTGQEQLVPQSAVMDFKARWEAIQQGFVDDPRSAVTDADKLVGDVLQKLSATFEEQHRELESQWSDGEPSTEDLRSALQRYRAFFDRLLTI